MIKGLENLWQNLKFADPQYLELLSVVYVLLGLWVAVFILRYVFKLRKTINSRHPLIGGQMIFLAIVILASMPLAIISSARPYFEEGSIQFEKGYIEIQFLVDNSVSQWMKDLFP